ncbi:MAG: Gfo/Idh/MocA family protein, partial [Thermomicrobiales bacterium]
MIRLGVLGCGDVAFRTYLPGFAALRGRAAVVACSDPVAERAAQFAAEVEAILGEPCAVRGTLDDMLAVPGLDGVLNLSPAPFHFETTSKVLAAGLNCYSEKPIAGTLDEARALTRMAQERGVLLLCAPATMASSRFRWLKEQLAGGLIGRPTLAIGQMANMGPAAWREYKGDPAVFYTDKVGPDLDTVVYLHQAVTGLLGA